MKVLLTPIGSAGDNYPFIGLGAELSRRGHDVTVITNDHFAPAVRTHGLNFLSVGTDEEYRAAMLDPNLWHPTRALKTVLRLIGQQIRRLFDLLRVQIADRPMIVAPTFDLASRSLQDRFALPVVTLHLQPVALRTGYDMGVMAGTTNWSFLPRWLKHLLWLGVDHLMIDPVLAPTINGMRRQLGLPPIKRVLADNLHSPLRTIGLFPEWFARPQPDWPGQLRLTGFPLFDVTGEDFAAVEGYLSAGAPPLVFTPGSANIHGHAFFTAAIDACQRLGRRGMLLTRFADQLPQALPPCVARFDYAPLSRILPRCAALVHHGGIGTTASALAAGIPQLIMPLAHDQPDNAHRVLQLGAGGRLMPRRFTGPRLARTLSSLLTSSTVREKCTATAHRIRQTNAIAATCDLIEEVMPHRTHPQAVPA